MWIKVNSSKERESELENNPTKIETQANTRKHGIGTIFKTLCAPTHKDLEKYTRDKYLKEQTEPKELNPELKMGMKLLW